MLKDEYPGLWQFLGAYLTQDWPDEYPEPLMALDDFIAGEPATALLVPDEIDRLLRDAQDGAALERLLVNLGSGYVPSAAGLDPREWLLQVRARLAAT